MNQIDSRYARKLKILKMEAYRRHRGHYAGQLGIQIGQKDKSQVLTDFDFQIPFFAHFNHELLIAR